jgi:hypothetical protein
LAGHGTIISLPSALPSGKWMSKCCKRDAAEQQKTTRKCARHATILRDKLCGRWIE